METQKIVAVSAAVAAVAFIGAKTVAGNMAETRIDAAIEKLGPAVEVQYDNASVDLLGLDVHISGIKITSPFNREEMRIEEITLHDMDTDSDVPMFMSVSIEGAELPTEALAWQFPAIRQIHQLGYEENINVDLHVDYKYDKDDGQMSINSVRLNADEVGEIEIQLVMANVDPATLMFAYPSASISSARIAFEDDSLVKRIMEFVADSKGGNVDDMTDDLVKSIEEQAADTDNDFLADSLEELANFVDDQDEISLEITPDSPVSIQQIMQLALGGQAQQEQLVELLKLEVDS